MAKKETFTNKNAKELKKLLAEKREALRDFRFNMKGSRVRNTKEGAAHRKDIARILQVLGAMEKETAVSAKAADVEKTQDK